MPIGGWSIAVSEAIGIIKTIVGHKLKSADEKLKDDRYKHLKGWQKWKAINKQEQDERNERVNRLRSS